MALSRVVSEIYNVEKYCDLEIPVKGQSRSLKVLLFDIFGFLLEFYSIFVPKTEIFDLKNIVTLKTGLGVRQCHHAIERV